MAELGEGFGLAEIGRAQPPSMAVISGNDPRPDGAPVRESAHPRGHGRRRRADADGWLTILGIGAAGFLLRDSVEIDEMKYPMLVTEQRIIPDSEGAGRFRGVTGRLRRVRPGRLRADGGRLPERRHGQPGRAACAAASTAAPRQQRKRYRDGTRLRRARLLRASRARARRDDRLGLLRRRRLRAAGERDPVRVANDVREGWITPLARAQVYRRGDRRGRRRRSASNRTAPNVIAPAPVSTLGRLLELRAENDDGAAFLQVGDERRTAQQLIDSATPSHRRSTTAAFAAGPRRSHRRELHRASGDVVWLRHARRDPRPDQHSEQGSPARTHPGDSEPKVVLSATDHLPKLVELDRPESVRTIWTIGTTSVPDWKGVRMAPFTPGDASFGATPSQAVDHPAAVLYTSGTTGPSKGVVCPHSQFYWWGLNTADALGINSRRRALNCLPLFHMNALNTIAQGLISGARVVIGPRFSASRFWRRVIEADANVTTSSGRWSRSLSPSPPGELDRAHRVRIVLGPATPAHLWSTFEDRFGVRLVEGHGMTETNFVIGPLEDTNVRGGWAA